MADERKTGENKAMAAERSRHDRDGRAAVGRDAAAMRTSAQRTAERMAARAAERDDDGMEPDYGF